MPCSAIPPGPHAAGDGDAWTRFAAFPRPHGWSCQATAWWRRSGNKAGAAGTPVPPSLPKPPWGLPAWARRGLQGHPPCPPGCCHCPTLGLSQGRRFARSQPPETAIVGVRGGPSPHRCHHRCPTRRGAERVQAPAPPRLLAVGPGAKGSGRAGARHPAGRGHDGSAPGRRHVPPCPAPAPAPACQPGRACSRPGRRHGGAGSCPDLPGPARRAALAPGRVPALGWGGVLHPSPALSHAMMGCRELGCGGQGWVTPRLGMCLPRRGHQGGTPRGGGTHTRSRVPRGCRSAGLVWGGRVGAPGNRV